ncbi:aspartic peptidase domain-containing protein, partial [Talaromyces proteolyticus]
RAVSRRSSGTTTVPLQNAYVEYLVEVSVGTPPQKIQSQLDTGSSDLWFPTASQCPDTTTCPYGYFTPSKSSTFAEVAPNEFNITYGDGSGAIGDYFNDTLTIAGTTVKDFTMAVAREVTGEPVIGSVMGVSYPALDASNKGVTYPNYPQALVNSGFINTVAYSLWLDDLAANTGSILFAGVDKAKFCGALEVVDVQPYQGGIYAFYVTLNSISYTTGSGTSTIASTASLALLDSGTSLTAVPQDVLQTIVSQFPTAQYDSQYSVYVVPCSAGQQAGHFTFTFGNKAIRVDLSEYVLQENEQGSCRLGFQASPDDTYILGDTFLRSAYVVYDLVNNQIGLASSSFNGGESDVVAFPSYGAHIPQLTGSCSSTTTTST